jgi:hypothetical protein
VVARSAAGAGAIAQRVELAPDRAFLEALERRHGARPIPGRIHLEELRVGSDLCRRGQHDGRHRQVQGVPPTPTYSIFDGLHSHSSAAGSV